MRRLSVLCALALAGSAWADQGSHGGRTWGGRLPPYLSRWDQSEINEKLLRAMARDARRYRGEPEEELSAPQMEAEQVRQTETVEEQPRRYVEQMPVGEVWANDPSKNSPGFMARHKVLINEANQMVDRARDARIRGDIQGLRDVQTDIDVFRRNNPDFGRR